MACQQLDEHKEFACLPFWSFLSQVDVDFATPFFHSNHDDGYPALVDIVK
jgi:hypothetical protein